MFVRFKFFVTVGTLFLATNFGFAQENNPLEIQWSATDDFSGMAYEFSGVTKFITFPSKIVFGSHELPDLQIFDGYRGNLSEIRENCSLEGNTILVRIATEWWEEPAYGEISLANIQWADMSQKIRNQAQERWPHGIDIAEEFSDDVIVPDLPDRSQVNENCRSELAQAQFFFDSGILSDAVAGVPLNGSEFIDN